MRSFNNIRQSKAGVRHRLSSACSNGHLLLRDEIWKDIKGYEGMYQISNLGRVKSLKRGGVRILKLNKKKRGYIDVVLSKKGNVKTIRVHRLVALAFLKNKNKYPCINHIDNCPSNNQVVNLEWTTYLKNTQHALRQGRMTGARGEIQTTSKLVKKQVLQIRKLSGKISQEAIAKRYGVSRGAITSILLRKNWKHI